MSSSLTATNTGSLIPRSASSNPHGTLIVSVAGFTLPSPRRGRPLSPHPCQPWTSPQYGRSAHAGTALEAGRGHNSTKTRRWGVGPGLREVTGSLEDGPESQAAARPSQPISPPRTRRPGSYTTRCLSLGGEAAWSLPTDCIEARGSQCGAQARRGAI